MSFSREMKLLQKAKNKAQNSKDIREEATICNQLGDLLSRNGDYEAAIMEHRQELSLSEVLNDRISRAVAHRKIGECFAELGNIEAALKHQRCHLDLARSVNDLVEEQRALATIGRTYLFRFESDQSKKSLKEAEDAFRKSLSIVDDLLGTVPERDIHEMKARLFLNLGVVCDHLGEPKRCSEFIRRSVFTAEKSGLLEDLYRANFHLGNIFFRNGQHSNSLRCLEQAKECARKMKDKFSESECFYCIGKVQLSLGDFVTGRRSFKKALLLGSQQPQDRQAVKKHFKYADRGCKLEEELGEVQARKPSSHEAVGLEEQLGDLYCKVGCFHKAVNAYQAQLTGAEALGKPARELAVIHVSLATTFADLGRHSEAVGHYKQDLALRQGSPAEECSSWLNIAAAQEESGSAPEDQDSSYSAALHCAQTSGQAGSQKRVLRLWLAARRRKGSSDANDTEAKLLELCASEGWNPDGSDGEEALEEEMDNSESQDESDVILSDSDEDLEGYDKMVSGRRKARGWNKRNIKGETAVHRACIDGDLRQVQYLIEQGHPVNTRDNIGWTPLHEACNFGRYDIVAVLLDRGAHINDQGGKMCEGLTPLHDSLNCGHFEVARLLVERGAAVNLRNARGQTALDTLRQWQRTYKKELDHETRQACAATERLLMEAVAGVHVAATPPKPFDALQDSQLFDAENSEPLSSTGGGSATSQDRSGSSDWLKANACISLKKRQLCSSSERLPARGTEATLLYGPSSSDDSDSDSPVSPLRPVRQRLSVQAAQSQKDTTPNQEVGSVTNPGRESGQDPPAPYVFARDEYHSAIRGLGSAKTLLQGRSTQPHIPSTPGPSSSSKSALVPTEEYMEDDWLDDDLAERQPKKKRRIQDEQNSTARVPNSQMSYRSSALPPSSARGPSLKRNSSLKAQQVKMTQMPGMIRLGRREVNTSHSPTLADDDGRPDTPPPPQRIHMQMMAASTPTTLPPPIRMRVRVQDDIFLIPVLQSEADSCTVSWLCDQAAQRYYQKCGLLPRLSLQKEGALLSPHDLLLAVLHTNEEVLAEVSSWDLPPLQERYKKACISLAVEENRRVTRLCEIQDGSSSMLVCGLGLAASSLRALLRALKLQASLTELRMSGNRLHDNLLAELVATAATMPRLCLLDISANQVTGEGLEKAASTIKGLSHPAFPCLKELNLSLNPLGDNISESLSSLLSSCPLLAELSLRGCGLTSRFLQQHRLLLASALTGMGHLKSVSLSHNALGSTGFELVLKTLPLHALTHLDLSGVRRGTTDYPALEHLANILSQDDCSLTHLNLAANGLTDGSAATLARCLPICLNLVNLDLSGNPSITSIGLHSILSALREARRSLTLLNLQGCQVSGPLDSEDLDALSELIQDLRLCSQGLNKLDRQALKQSWTSSKPHGYFVDRKAAFFLSTAATM
ncbi:LOW QUALITY PROTEIN: tonsoku-like protein [Phycodurus eques]|uniref:LOW QUALITY PROTEIN: tonsoku-like protein n=1 Tax=Phycodurus eques TaxID=693459 RepID=UPI002ACDE6FB|nr:LOW QUALITY PROTEIN: tonsoku-like protein [Phycodurus eques]